LFSFPTINRWFLALVKATFVLLKSNKFSISQFKVTKTPLFSQLSEKTLAKIQVKRETNPSKMVQSKCQITGKSSYLLNNQACKVLMNSHLNVEVEHTNFSDRQSNRKNMSLPPYV
jgi:hypothetical protein